MLAIAALVKLRPHRLKVESKLLPNDDRELLSTMLECESRAIYVAINKSNPDSGKHLYGNEL